MVILIKLDDDAEAETIKSVLLDLQAQEINITTISNYKKTSVKKTPNKTKSLKYFSDVIGIWKDQFSEAESSVDIQRQWRQDLCQRN